MRKVSNTNNPIVKTRPLFPIATTHDTHVDVRQKNGYVLNREIMSIYSSLVPFSDILSRVLRLNMENTPLVGATVCT